MLFFRIVTLVIVFCAALTRAQAGEPQDFSKADTDGPHVFYRGKKIVVKWVERQDTNAVARATSFQDRSEIELTCHVQETGDRFSFRLRDSLRVEAHEYAMPAKMLVLSDIEGNFKAFQLMLQGAKIINEKFEWTFGTGHLVLLGDYFDRGLNVTECLWLVYKLETEAEAAGGKIHFILGNHEVLNLQGSTQYVRKKYLENAALIGEPYLRWYDKDSELGRWLRTKNAIEKIGTYAMCHGGISPQLADSGLSLADINRLSRQHLGTSLANLKSDQAKMIFDYTTGIFWYRGMAKNQLEKQEITRLLHYIGAKRIIIGHTLQSDLTALYAGRVICVDLYHEENLRQGFMKTLWVEDGLCYGLNSQGAKSSVFSIASARRTNTSTNNEEED